jgi:predicted amidophosphoribosyltransferase
MDKRMMQEAAAKAMKSLEGLDASKVKAVSIIFSNSSKPEMEDGEYDEEEVCPECGAEMQDGECPECGYQEHEEPSSHKEKGEPKSFEGTEEDYKEDTPEVRKKEYHQLKQMRGK